MAAYVINQLSIYDTGYQEDYYTRAGVPLAKHGGKQIMGAAPLEKLEGNWELPERVSVLKFPPVEQAKAWWDDPEYAELKKARQVSTTGRVMLVEGID